MKSNPKKSMLLGLLLVIATGSQPGLADESHANKDYPPLSFDASRPSQRTPPRLIHPRVPLLDAQGMPVHESAQPLSLMQSCGQCHDSAYIESHNYHAQAGLDELWAENKEDTARPWDLGPGLFGRWDPLLYRRLSGPQEKEDTLDLSTAAWIQTMGARHVGGGPAVYGFGQPRRPLDQQEPREQLPADSLVRDENGHWASWDWKKSGTVELNCLLCHSDRPDNVARIAALESGDFRWASTATLQHKGLVTKTESGYRWNLKGKSATEGVTAQELGLASPSSNNCRQCHGRACRCVDPVVFENSLDNWATETTGTVFSPDRIFDSGMNIEGKETLSTPWDVHAERLLKCTDCHHALNNPTYLDKAQNPESPHHLRYDARKLSTNQYLLTPNHNLAKGRSTQGTVARHQEDSMRTCADCHDATVGHDFLPYQAQHFAKLDCKACHISRVYAPVRQINDWSMLDAKGEPLVSHAGVQGPVNDPATMIRGMEPVLLPIRAKDGSVKLSPHHLMSSWFWTGGTPPRPVPLELLKKALFSQAGTYQPQVLSALDDNRDGHLQAEELRLTTTAKHDVIQARLRAVGVVEPTLQGEWQPFTISHGVSSKQFAIADCAQCHHQDSRITRETLLAEWVPGGVLPSQVKDSHLLEQTQLHIDPQGKLRLSPQVNASHLYVHGTGHFIWMDKLGVSAVALSFLGIVLHGVLRLWSHRRRRKKK